MSIFNLMKLEMTYDPNKENYEIDGQLFNIRNKKRLYSIFGRNNIDNIFTVLATNNVKFNRVFVFEVVEILKYIIYNNISFMNIRGCKQLLDFIKETEYEHEYPEVKLDWNALKRMEYEPFDYAKEFYNHYEEYKKKTGYRGILLDACIGAGKEIEDSTLVRIPNGWTKIKDIKVDDLVMTQDGSYTKVTGVYPQGKKDIYTVTFEDGRTILAGLEHQWSISVDNEVKTSNTEEMIKLLRKGKVVNIPLCKPEDNKPIYTTIHPYIQGILYNSFREDNNCYLISLYSNDDFNKFTDLVKDNFNRLIIPNKQGYHFRLNIDGYMDIKEYYNASIEQKYELLRGIFTSRYAIFNKNNIVFKTRMESYANSIRDIVFSLGDKCKLLLDKDGYYNLVIYSKSLYNYTGCNKPRIIDNEYDLRVISIKKTGKDNCTCIAVEHPSKLYVIENYIVTHNTNMSLTLSEMLNVDKIIIVCPLPTLDRVWIKSITSELYKKKDQPVWHSKSNSKYNNEKFIIVHYEAMEKVLPIIQSVSKNKVSVIVDESHNFADKNSKRTLQLLDLVNVSNTKHLILQSGTPIKAYSTEIINVYRFLDARVKGRIYDKLYSIYSNPKGFFRNILPDRYQDISYRIEKKESNLKPLIKTYVSVTLKNGNDYTLDTIRKEMGIFIERRIKEVEEHKEEYRKSYELCLKTAIDNGCTKTVNMRKYKSTVETIIRVGKNRQYMLIPNEMKLANDMEKEIEKYLPNEMVKVFRDVKTLVKYPILRIQGECLGQIVMGARIKCHKDIANELDYETYLNNTLKDTIIFSNYVEVCEVANKRVKSLGYNPINIYGESTKQLASLVKDFTTKEKYNPLITTYKTLSTGVPLTNANIIITLDLPFRMYLFEQAVGRAWRVGQDSQVTVYIPSLDTGDVPNINARNFDIISFFNEEVERLTGVSATLDISETKVSKNSLAIKSLHNELFNSGLLNFNLEDMEYRDLKIVENDNTNIKNPILNW